MAKVRRIEIEGYRSIGEQITIDFPDGKPVVLIGENNAGKSNIVNAIEIILGERWPGTWSPEDHDFHGRNAPETAAAIGITCEVRDFLDNFGKPVSELRFRHEDRMSSLTMAYATHDTEYRPTTEVRQQCACVVVSADRRLSYQLSYTSQWTLLSKLMTRFHKALVSDEDRVTALKENFERLEAIFNGVPEFAAFSQYLSKEVQQLSTSLQYGLDVDFSAYDPSNYFRALRVMPSSDGITRSFDELGTGQEQILALGFAYAYAATFASAGHGLVLVIEEPEAHLHPLAQEWLAQQMHRFVEDGVQVVITTHSPRFLDFHNLDGAALVRKRSEDGCTFIEHRNATQLAQFCQEKGSLGTTAENVLDFYAGHATEEIKAGFFARAIVLVEGPTESLSLPILMRKCGADLSRLGVACIGVGGKGSLAKWWRLFTCYGIPTCVVFDNDSKKDDPKGVKRRDAMAAVGIDHDRQNELLQVSGLVVDEGVAVFGGNYETTMRDMFQEYESLEAQARAFLGSSNKQLVARWVAERIEVPKDSALQPLADRLREIAGAEVQPAEVINLRNSAAGTPTHHRDLEEEPF